MATAAAALLLAACGGGGSSDPTAPVARVEILSASAWLAGAGQTRPLAAQAYDADGNPLDATITWTSSRPGQVAVAANGTLNAMVAAGSAQISAQAGGISSAPILAFVAAPAPGVTVVADAAIVGGPVETDPDAAPSLANTYQVTLEGAAPVVGALLLGSGDKALAGRVMAVEPLGAQTRVTLQLVPITDLFATLQIEEVFDLSRAEVLVPPEVSDFFDVARSADTWTFTPKPRTSSQRRRPTAVTGTYSEDILPFRDCEVGFEDYDGLGDLPFSLEPPIFSVTVSPTLDLVYSRLGGLTRFIVNAEPAIQQAVTLKAEAKLKGKAECKLQLFALRLPIGGPLAFFFGGMVPVGVGLALEADATLADVRVGTQAQASTKLSLGWNCPGPTCEFVRSMDDAVASVSPIVDGPNPVDDARLEIDLKLFGYLETEVGSPLLRSLRFEAFDAQVGGKLEGNFAAPITQLLDEAYASSYGAALEGEAKVGTGIDDIVTLLGLSDMIATKFEFERALAGSPQALTIDADRASFAVGDTVNVRVTLDPATLNFLPGVYNVDSVQLRRNVGSVTEVLATQAAGSGQQVFDFSVSAPHAGDVSEWSAFVTTYLLPFELTSLELGRVAAAGAEVLLLSGVLDTDLNCSASASESDDATHYIRVDDDKEEEPVNCLAVAGSARATASASASVSGPALDRDTEAPRPIASFTGSGSVSASAAATVPSGSTTMNWWAVGNASAEADGRWELRVQGQAVTMTITGSVTNGYFSAEWAKSAGGLGVPGNYGLSGGEDEGASGALSHSVRLEPGQTIRIQASTHRSGGDVRLGVEWNQDDPRSPGGSESESVNASYGFTVTFTP